MVGEDVKPTKEENEGMKDYIQISFIFSVGGETKL